MCGEIELSQWKTVPCMELRNRRSVQAVSMADCGDRCVVKMAFCRRGIHVDEMKLQVGRSQGSFYFEPSFAASIYLKRYLLLERVLAGLFGRRSMTHRPSTLLQYSGVWRGHGQMCLALALAVVGSGRQVNWTATSLLRSQKSL